jgi:hypothetical protein
VLCKSECFHDEHDQTATTTDTTATITNKINNTSHPARRLAVTEERRWYSFNTLSNSAHIGVGGQHEAPAALPPEKIR